MIKFHYHAAPRAVPLLGIRPGDRLCHVYSDSSLVELFAWGQAHRLRPEWADRRNSLPHFDLYGERLRFCGPGVTRQELVHDIRRWRNGLASAEEVAGGEL